MDTLDEIQARARARGGTGTQYGARLGSVRISTELDAWLLAEIQRRYEAGQPSLTSDVVRDVLSAAALGLCGDIALYVNAHDILGQSATARLGYINAVKRANQPTRRH